MPIARYGRHVAQMADVRDPWAPWPPTGPVALRSTLSVYRFGGRDPTTRLNGTATTGEMWRATHTPDGPATLHLRWNGYDVATSTWGPGGGWLAATVPGLIGQLDRPVSFDVGHPVVRRAQHRHPGLRLGASGTLYHELLPVILGQRITGGEAVAQWARLTRALGEPAPGPCADLLLPPSPASLIGRPSWWFHPLGIEAKRADVLRVVARHAAALWEWSAMAPADCAAKLSLLPGVGQWTIGSALGPALGDPDAFALGDYHLKNVVAFALAGEPRGTDDRMIELLSPYVGQRGRVVRLITLDGHAAPKFGPRQRILPMHRW